MEAAIQKKYSVALSFSGDDRAFAEKLAETLQASSIKVFYDRYEEHELWGKNLHEALREVYTKECRYCVIILTSSYLTKMWPVFERRQIIDRMATEHGQDVVLPIRLSGFSDDVPGLSNGIGYLSVLPDEHIRVADALIKKLGEPGYEIDSSAAYMRALKMIKEREQGLLEYDRIYTSIETIKSSFKLIGGEILNWIGHEFYWKRESGEPLIFFAKNDALDDLKGRGLVEVCRFNVPTSWVGCGLWSINWRDKKDDDLKGQTDVEEEAPELLFALHLFSEHPQDIFKLIEEEETPAAFLGGIHLSTESAQIFYDLAKSRYSDLR